MEWHRFSHVSEALEKTGPFLEKMEAENNLALGIMQSLTSKPPSQEPLLAAVTNNGEPLLVMVQTPPHKLIISGTGPLAETAAKQAASILAASDAAIPGVIGHPQIAELFAKEWGKRKDCTYAVTMKQRIYKLEHVQDIPFSPGHLRAAQEDDLELVAQWLHQFFTEVGEPSSLEDARNKAQQTINASSLYLWDDTNPVCMAAKTRPTQSGIVVSMVYTPPESRKKGYASSCVAALSRLLLSQGFQFLSLYTDLSNPTSNHIYQEIGYEPIQDSVVYTFA